MSSSSIEMKDSSVPRPYPSVKSACLIVAVLMTVIALGTASAAGQAAYAAITNLVVDPPRPACGRSFVIRVSVAYQFPEQTHWLRVVVRDLETEFRKIIVSSEEKEVRKDGSWGFNVPVASPSSPCRLRLGVYVQFKTATMDWTEARNEGGWRMAEVEIVPETTSVATVTLTLTTTTRTPTETTVAVSSKTTDTKIESKGADSQSMLILGVVGAIGLMVVFLTAYHFRKREPTGPKGLVDAGLKRKSGSKMDYESKKFEIQGARGDESERYLKRLEELKAEGRISDNVYQRLRKKYRKDGEEK